MRPSDIIRIIFICTALYTTACGDGTETQSGESDPTEAAHTSDPSELPEPTESSDPTDITDPADDSDPSDEPHPDPEGTDCPTLLECIDSCWLDNPDSAEDCRQTCEEEALPQALIAANNYFECMDNCEANHSENDALGACYEEECGPLYDICIAPPECIAGCENYDEICGDGGPLHTRSSYLAKGVLHRIKRMDSQAVIKLKPNLLHTPDLRGIERIETYPNLFAKHLVLVHFNSSLEPDNLQAHPALEATYSIYTSARGHRLISTDELIAHMPKIEQSTRLQVLAAAKTKLIRPVNGLPGTWLIKTLSGSSIEAAHRLNQSEHVAWASPNFLRQYQLKFTPNDPYFDQQWHHLNTGTTQRSVAGNDMRTTAAWDQTKGSSEVKIAVNDDGVDLRHNDLPWARNADESIIGVNIPGNIDEALAQGCCQHGTAVAGVSCASANNEIGTAGVCPECSIIPVWTNFNAPNEDLAVAETFTLSTQNGAWAINNSWGPPDGNPAVIETPTPFEPLPDVVEQAIQETVNNGRDGKGTAIVFAAGNGNEDIASDPFAAHPLTIAVAAVNARGIKSSYSDFGDSVWVAAPSSGNHLMPGIVTSDALGDFGYISSENPDSLDPEGNVMPNFGGTSSATPAVTGVIGLMLSINPELTASQVKDILRRTSRKIDKSNARYEPDPEGFLRSIFYGYGMVDAHAAVRAASLGCEPGNEDQCIPLTDCTGGLQGAITEICNGIDDNCDGVIDEDACPSPVALGDICDMTGTCEHNCTWMENDPFPACLANCDNEETCAEDYTCQGGVCVPNSGRLSVATDEVCDGYDNDLNGETDETGCTATDDATCEFTAQCDNTNGETQCVEGFCAPTCTSNEECDSGVECQVLATQYGESDDTAICAPSLNTGLTCIEACIFLKENAPAPIFQGIVNCITQALTCDEAIECVPL